jgi:hypothetical protein
MRPYHVMVVVAAVLFSGCDMAGCGDEPRRDVDYGEGEGLEVGSMIYGVYQLFAASGYSAEVGPELELPYIDRPVRGLRVNGSPVYVFAYESDGDVDRFVGIVSPDGSSVGKSTLPADKPVHFYRKGKVIALYRGDKESTLKILDEILGEPFAGS